MITNSRHVPTLRRTRPVRGWGRPASRLVAGVLLLLIVILGLWKAAEMAGGLL